MNKRYKFTMDPKNIAILCGMFCMIMIAISFKFEKQVEPIKTTVGAIFTPMQNGINYIGTNVTKRITTIHSIKTLMKENGELKEELKKVKGENRLLLQQKDELDSLRKLYDIEGKYEDLPKVAARIISKDPTNWYSTFTIDKGSKDGLKVDMNVIANDGLVGIISEVGYNYSKIRTIIDDKSNVTSVFLKSTEICNVSGNLKSMKNGKIDVESISMDVDVSDGEALYTSYESPKFQPGILIGYVSDIKEDSNGLTRSAKLTPVINFEELDTVLVITSVKTIFEEDTDK